MLEAWSLVKYVKNTIKSNEISRNQLYIYRYIMSYTHINIHTFETDTHRYGQEREGIFKGIGATETGDSNTNTCHACTSTQWPNGLHSK